MSGGNGGGAFVASMCILGVIAVALYVPGGKELVVSLKYVLGGAGLLVLFVGGVCAWKGRGRGPIAW